MNQGKNDLLVNYRDQPTGSARKMHWCHAEKKLVHRIRRFKQPVPEKSHSGVQKTQRICPTNLHMALFKTRIYWLFRLSLISETPICKWLPLSLQHSLQSADVPQKKIEANCNEIQTWKWNSIKSLFETEKGIGELRMKVSARYFGTDSSWASSPSVPCIHSSTRIRCSMASHSHNGKPTSIQRLDHMFRCNLKVTWWIGSPVDMLVLFRDGWWCELNLDHEHLSMINGIGYMCIYIYTCTYMIYTCVLEIGNCWRGSILKPTFRERFGVALGASERHFLHSQSQGPKTARILMSARWAIIKWINCRTESSPWTNSWHMKWCLSIRNIIFQASFFRSEQLGTRDGKWN